MQSWPIQAWTIGEAIHDHDVNEDYDDLDHDEDYNEDSEDCEDCEDHDEHREGGWPKDVKTELMEQKNKFIRKVKLSKIIISTI